jgi:hypothetical protein
MEKEPVKWTVSSVFGVIIMLIILAVFLQGCFSSFGANDTEAFVISQGFVEDRLKSPSTADFCGMHGGDSEVTEVGDEEWEISSCVDSENGFGAKVRTFYTVTVKYLGDDEWELVDIEF